MHVTPHVLIIRGPKQWTSGSPCLAREDSLDERHARHGHRGEDEAVHDCGDRHIRQLAPRVGEEREQRDQNGHQ